MNDLAFDLFAAVVVPLMIFIIPQNEVGFIPRFLGATLYTIWILIFYLNYNLRPHESLFWLNRSQSIDQYRLQRAINNADKAINSIEQHKKPLLKYICKILLQKGDINSIDQCYTKYSNNAENLPYYKTNQIYNMRVANLVEFNKMEKRLMLYKNQFESVLPMLEINKNLKGLKIGTIQQEIFSNLKEFENNIRK